jgi:hypothetical protein
MVVHDTADFAYHIVDKAINVTALADWGRLLGAVLHAPA